MPGTQQKGTYKTCSFFSKYQFNTYKIKVPQKITGFNTINKKDHKPHRM